MSPGVDANEGGIAYGILEDAMEERRPDPLREADVRAVFAAHMAIQQRNACANGWMRLEQYFDSKEDERIWRSSIVEMRRAVEMDPALDSPSERASLLAALVDVRLSARSVRDFDAEHGSHLDLSNHAMEMDRRREAGRSTGDPFSPSVIVAGNARHLSDDAFGMIARMVSKEGMDHDLRGLALEAARTMEKIELGWGERRADDPQSIRVGEHTMAVAHRSFMKKRMETATVAHQASLSM